MALGTAAAAGRKTIWDSPALMVHQSGLFFVGLEGLRECGEGDEKGTREMKKVKREDEETSVDCWTDSGRSSER